MTTFLWCLRGNWYAPHVYYFHQCTIFLWPHVSTNICNLVTGSSDTNQLLNKHIFNEILMFVLDWLFVDVSQLLVHECGCLVRNSRCSPSECFVKILLSQDFPGFKIYEKMVVLIFLTWFLIIWAVGHFLLWLISVVLFNLSITMMAGRGGLLTEPSSFLVVYLRSSHSCDAYTLYTEWEKAWKIAHKQFLSLKY